MKCKYCSKEYKKERYLLAHEDKCSLSLKPIQDSESLEEVLDDKVVEDVVKVSSEACMSDNIKRKISKLRDKRRSCGDAKTKKDIENEIERLEGL